MAKISFPTKPQKVFYSYLSDGHIYEITSKKPELVADGGGYWSCYFECEPYHKDTDGKTYLLYEVVGTDANTKFIATNSGSFNSGNTYKWTKDGVTYTEHTASTQYFTRNGKYGFNMPKSAAELPQILYSEYVVKTSFTNGSGDTAVTYVVDQLIDGTVYNSLTAANKNKCEVKRPPTKYYLDKLIKCGAKYNVSNNKFTPMDVKTGSGETTYGDILLDLVEDNISVNAFDACVNTLPKYLTGTDLTKAYSVSSIGYTVPANYLIMFGPLFIEKLNEAMKEKGDAIVKKYMNNKIATRFKKVTIESSVASGVGTVTSTPSA